MPVHGASLFRAGIVLTFLMMFEQNKCTIINIQYKKCIYKQPDVIVIIIIIILSSVLLNAK